MCLSLQAQVPVVQLHSTQELGDLRLTTVYQDQQGWLWLGAQQGVYRFDGQEFMPIKLPENMVANPVSALFESNQRLWVGFHDGSIAFLPSINNKIPITTGALTQELIQAPKLTLWAPEEGLPKARITGILDDRQGALWISTYGEGLYVWKNERLYQFNQTDEGLASNDIYALAADENVAFLGFTFRFCNDVKAPGLFGNINL